MEQLLNKIEAYKNEAGSTVATDAKTVEEFRIKWLGTKGIVKEIKTIEAIGVSTANLFLSDRAHIIARQGFDHWLDAGSLDCDQIVVFLHNTSLVSGVAVLVITFTFIRAI